MATVPSPPANAFATVGHIVASVPGIPVSRIRLRPTPGTATEIDVLLARERDRLLCELIDGVLVEKTRGYEESIIAQNILAIIHAFVKKHDLGVVAGEGGMLRLSSSQIRIPDGSFISWSQLPGRIFPNEPIWGVHPDLAIEVLSASNTKEEITRKIGEYFETGTRLVWIVELATRTVNVFTSPTQSTLFEIHQTLDGGDVLPGFVMPVGDVFAGTSQPGK